MAAGMAFFGLRLLEMYFRSMRIVRCAIANSCILRGEGESYPAGWAALSPWFNHGYRGKNSVQMRPSKPPRSQKPLSSPPDRVLKAVMRFIARIIEKLQRHPKRVVF